MRMKPGAARVVTILVAGLSLAPFGGAIRSTGAQEPARAENPRLRQLLEERTTRMFAIQSREKTAAARKNWREGRHEDAVKVLEQCLEEARKTLGERPNAPSVDILK